jgi:phosphatidate cytidylyltransferase
VSGDTAEPAADSGRDRLGLRVLSAVVLAALALGAAYLGGALFSALSGVVGLLAWLEWRKLQGCSISSPAALLGCLGIAAALAVFSLFGTAFAVAASAGTALLVAVVERGSVRDRAFAAVGIALVAIVVVATVALRGESPEGRATIFWLFAVVWASDIGAYAAGRTFGGPKLAPRISPGKTWAGCFGGVAVAIGASILMGWLMPLVGWIRAEPAIGVLLAGGAIGSAVGQVGDLAESALKRRVGAKDSGRLIPGHGGVLDRIDAYAFAVLALALAAIASGGRAPWLS